jgi:hypothetical protein
VPSRLWKICRVYPFIVFMFGVVKPHLFLKMFPKKPLMHPGWLNAWMPLSWVGCWEWIIHIHIYNHIYSYTYIYIHTIFDGDLHRFASYFGVHQG